MEIEARDYLGQVLNVGDEVIYVRLNYREFKRGIVKKLTKCTLLVGQEGSNYNDKQSHNQVIKVIDNG